MVKAKVMPFLTSVEVARKTNEELKENKELDTEEIAAMLDPEKEQENQDADEEEEEEHPEYLHIDPNQVEEESKKEPKKKKSF